MANTTTVSGSTIQIVPDGTTDWVWSTDLTTGMGGGGGILIKSIQFLPSATSDRLIIHEGGLDGAAIFDSGPFADAYDARVKTFDPNKWCKPYFDASDCTFGTAASCRIYIEIA